ncbi:MAG TPA: hypothetical protein PK659_11015, partial [Methanothrix sp.]
MTTRRRAVVVFVFLFAVGVRFYHLINLCVTISSLGSSGSGKEDIVELRGRIYGDRIRRYFCLKPLLGCAQLSQ